MSIPKGTEVETQAQSSGAAPSPTGAPCPSGDVPKEGSRDIQKQGKIISVPYDWCKSTDSPIPYRIWAWQSSSSNLANTVRQTDCGSHVLGSYVNECYGDEPGKGGGIHSGTYQAECTPMTASPTVRAEGQPMVRFLDKWHMNHGNTWGCLNNSEDMGKYAAPKLQNIYAKLSPIQSREEDQQALANGTQVAGGAPTPASSAGTAATTTTTTESGGSLLEQTIEATERKALADQVIQNTMAGSSSAAEGTGASLAGRAAGVAGRALGPVGALAGMTSETQHENELARVSTVRISQRQKSKRHELCELACECLQNRGDQKSYQALWLRNYARNTIILKVALIRQGDRKDHLGRRLMGPPPRSVGNQVQMASGNRS